MEEIFKQYGTPIIIVSVIVALIILFGMLLSTGDGNIDKAGIIYKQFENLITQFFQKANFTGIGGAPGTMIAGLFC